MKWRTLDYRLLIISIIGVTITYSSYNIFMDNKEDALLL